MQYRYTAIQTKQTPSNKLFVQFSAPATEIDRWAGVPQKKRFGVDSGGESVGFQREENKKRVENLGEFCSDDENIIQNPLLCSTRRLSFADATFLANEGENESVQSGTLIINIPEYDSYSMEDVLGHVRDYIEERIPELKCTTPDEEVIQKLKRLVRENGDFIPKEDTSDEDSTHADDEIPETGAALFEESHIIDFWNEIAGRHEVIKLMENFSGDSFLGFQRDALISYLQPVVLVDGQHRLRGALKATEKRMEKDDVLEEMEHRVIGGESEDVIENDILNRETRRLPVSLLLSDDPAEQVFQFVVVNQKATPIGRALLGTIISTTLSNDEMQKVASRLTDAGIALEESQVITYLTRLPSSPFYNLVERGLAGGASNLLQWGVFSSIVSIFKNLSGGKLYGNKNDYAEIWKSRFLHESNIIEKYETEGFLSPFEYWRKSDGPWRDVFISFFTKIRDKFGDQSTKDANNYWGNPRQSNLFNKVSLTILSADFFQYLVETKQGIPSAGNVNDLVDDWLEDVAGNYFNRTWPLTGVKKDSTGIRNQWAFLWGEYRKNPSQLPQCRNYRNSKI